MSAIGQRQAAVSRVWATLYNRDGVVKGHVEVSEIREAFEATLNLAFLFLLSRKPLLLLLVLLLLLLIATSARFQNPAVEARSTNHYSVSDSRP